MSNATNSGWEKKYAALIKRVTLTAKEQLQSKTNIAILLRGTKTAESIMHLPAEERFNQELPAKDFIWSSLYKMKFSSLRLTRKAAKAFIALPQAEGDRSVNDRYWTTMRFDQQNGYFFWNLVHLVRVHIKELGLTIRINGNTSVRVFLSLCDGPFVPTLSVCDVWVNTLDEAKTMWCQLDKSKSRTKSDKLCGLILGTTGWQEPVAKPGEPVKKQNSKKSIAARDLIAIQKGLNNYLTDGNLDLSLEELNAYLIAGGEFFEIAQRIREIFAELWDCKKDNQIKRAGVIAAIVAIFHKWPELAADFCRELINEAPKYSRQDETTIRRRLMSDLHFRLQAAVVSCNRGTRSKKKQQELSTAKICNIVLFYFECIRKNTLSDHKTRYDCYQQRPAGYEPRRARRTPAENLALREEKKRKNALRAQDL